MRKIMALACAFAVLAALGACDREEQTHKVHLTKGRYAGQPMTKLDAAQVTALERRAANGNY